MPLAGRRRCKNRPKSCEVPLIDETDTASPSITVERVDKSHDWGGKLKQMGD